jgi:hypothetical protein
MAKQIITVLTDDLDGGDADRTLEFGFDGVNYTIDLSDKNAGKLRKALDPYLTAATRVGRTGASERLASRAAARRAGRAGSRTRRSANGPRRTDTRYRSEGVSQPRSSRRSTPSADVASACPSSVGRPLPSPPCSDHGHHRADDHHHHHETNKQMPRLDRAHSREPYRRASSQRPDSVSRRGSRLAAFAHRSRLDERRRGDDPRSRRRWVTTPSKLTPRLSTQPQPAFGPCAVESQSRGHAVGLAGVGWVRYRTRPRELCSRRPATRLATSDELGASYHVEYMPEPDPSPGSETARGRIPNRPLIGMSIRQERQVAATRRSARIAATSLIGSTTRARPGWVEVAGGIALFAAVHPNRGCDSHLACARRLPPGEWLERGLCSSK